MVDFSDDEHEGAPAGNRVILVLRVARRSRERNVFLPIFLPVVQALKFDLVWFCTLVAVNLQTAYLSPPVAMAAYYLKAVAPKWELKHIYIGMFHFMVLQCIGLGVVFFFPQTALWLPTLLFGK